MMFENSRVYMCVFFCFVTTFFLDKSINYLVKRTVMKNNNQRFCELTFNNFKI